MPASVEEEDGHGICRSGQPAESRAEYAIIRTQRRNPAIPVAVLGRPPGCGRIVSFTATRNGIAPSQFRTGTPCSRKPALRYGVLTNTTEFIGFSGTCKSGLWITPVLAERGRVPPETENSSLLARPGSRIGPSGRRSVTAHWPTLLPGDPNAST